ncbi:MAG: hypothetical protein R3316_05455 [Rhodovibrionaceae bacterium]|nr:hypothetical protein [Rhodovibrionaceae bacterium]
MAPLWGGYVYVGLIGRLYCQGFALHPTIRLLLAVLAPPFGERAS